TLGRREGPAEGSPSHRFFPGQQTSLGSRPRPACPAGEAVQRLGLGQRALLDPGRLARPVKEFGGWRGWLEGRGRAQVFLPGLAGELLHRPRKAAGVEGSGGGATLLAAELLHRPHKAAGVGSSAGFATEVFFSDRHCPTRRAGETPTSL